MAASRAHPRSRGENSLSADAASSSAGSSPLTRGKPRDGPRCSSARRLIPAHAGKTLRVLESATDRAAHPRSRGENEDYMCDPAFEDGSSPLTRGKLAIATRRSAAVRLIPAHAGKTSSCALSFLTRAAHPRSRGENLSTRRKPQALSGSSPLTRGKPAGSFSPGISRRLIPAHAGKTREAPCLRRA